MAKRGRKRQLNPSIPDHIEQGKLPDNCYWDNSGNGHWWTKYQDETGKWRRRRIASKNANLSDLHKIMEEYQGINRDSFKWLADEFDKSPQFKELSLNTQKDYINCKNNVCKHPTRKQILLGDASLTLWSRQLVQKLIDQLTVKRGPSAANHALRYIRRLFRWGMNRGYCPFQNNPATGIEPAKERKRQRLPDSIVYMNLLNFAKERGQRKSHTKGSCSRYLWMIMEIGNLCRLRGIETTHLTDAHETNEGLLIQRTKGSRGNITRWNERLRDAWNAAGDYRKEVQLKLKRPTEMRPEKRRRFVNETGGPLTKSALDSAWDRMIKMAIKEGIIEDHQAFGIHDLKRRGTTDTKGTRADKKEATGHKSDSMLDVYDKSVPIVPAAGD